MIGDLKGNIQLAVEPEDDCILGTVPLEEGPTARGFLQHLVVEV